MLPHWPYILVMTNKSIINMKVQLSFWLADFLSCGCIASSGIDGSHSIHIYNLGGKCHTAFHIDHANLHFYQPAALIRILVFVPLWSFFDYSHSNCISNGSDLHILGDYWCWTFFHNLVWHLCIFLENYLFKSLSHIFTRSVSCLSTLSLLPFAMQFFSLI